MATLIRPDKLSQGSIHINSHRRVISELFSGRDSAVQLQDLLQKDFGGQGSVLAWEMAEKILRSFTESISMLSSTEAGEVCDDGGSIDWGASKKRPDSGSRNGRGCYKRRKGSKTWTEVSTTVEDSFAWRKYGQKEILNAAFPRCYFRCTHKHDQGCKATKQVQKMGDDPEEYLITYIGVHTCQRNTGLTPQIITETDPWELSDGSKPQANGHGLVNVPATVKQEHFKEDTHSDVTENSFPSLGSAFEKEQAVPYEQLTDFDTLDIDEFMAGCVALDAGDFALDEI